MDGGAPRFSPSFPDPPITSHDLEAGCSGGSAAFARSPSAIRRRGSYRAMVGPRTPTRSGAAAGFFCDPLSDEEPHHYLDSCFLCKKHLAGDRDIFMYRGDTPFCSEECRQQQIEMDETEGKKWKRISGMRKQGQQHVSGAATSPKSQKIRVRAAGTVVAG